MAEIKYDIPEGVRPSPCKGCSADIYWIRTKNGKWMPVDADGTPHWATCPDRKKFGKKREKHGTKNSESDRNQMDLRER